MYRTQILANAEAPYLQGEFRDGTPWTPPKSYAAVVWASPQAFRRAGIWTRLMGERKWVQIMFSGSKEDVEALVPKSQWSRTVLATGEIEGTRPDQTIALLVVEGSVRLAMKNSPTEEAWERFELEMTRAGLA